jgi:uncharacterized protein GlcG (DUF336 family)
MAARGRKSQVDDPPRRDNDRVGTGRHRIYPFAALFLLAALPLLVGCLGPLSTLAQLATPPGGPTTPLTAAEVTAVITTAAASLAQDTLVIAVVDREGNILGLFRKTGAPTTVNILLANRRLDVSCNELAVSLARTGAFFSNDQAPLSSRTVQFISREHFPPIFAFDGTVTGAKNTSPGALWDIENTNKGCALSTMYNAGMEITPPRSVDRTATGLGIAALPGGVPLFKMGKLVGGVGVTGIGGNQDLCEFAAISGAAGAGFGPNTPNPDELFIDGIRLPFVRDDFTQPVLTTLADFELVRPFGTIPHVFAALADIGTFVPIPDLTALAAAAAPATVTGTQASLRANVPEGWLVGPLGSLELNSLDVQAIVAQAIIQADQTRAAIRLPLDRTAKMVIAVSNLAGDIIGLYRMPDATVFSIDVAVSKARNVTYLSSLLRSPLDLPGVPMGTAITNRALRFASQPFFPQGIDGTLPGPFAGLRLFNQENPCTQGFGPLLPNQSGIVFFPGSVPLYKAGVVLVGGLGISGDGVDQDDLVSSAGGRFYEPIPNIRSDKVELFGVRLPYLKFPRAPGEGT